MGGGLANSFKIRSFLCKFTKNVCCNKKGGGYEQNSFTFCVIPPNKTPIYKFNQTRGFGFFFVNSKTRQADHALLHHVFFFYFFNFNV